MARQVNCRLIERQDDLQLHEILDNLVQLYHPDLIGANIILFWKLRWRPDRDGNLTMVRGVIPSDTMRELKEHDIAIYLNHDYWDELSPNQRSAYLDHGLCGVVRARDKDDTLVEDSAGRPVFRLRRHDVMEYQAIARRHGAYRDPLKFLVRAITQESTPAGHTTAAASSYIAAVAPELRVGLVGQQVGLQGQPTQENLEEVGLLQGNDKLTPVSGATTM